jgi:uncharacterized RDD family membrane protein YckC
VKCPKCGYLGFDDLERCRNCGYDFSLTPPPEPELEIRSGEQPEVVLDDLALIDAASGEHAEQPAPPAPTPVLSRLPLFGAETADDLPLITRPSPPRAPLAVRRATPETPRARPETPRPALLEMTEPGLPGDRQAGAFGGFRGAGEADTDGTAPAGFLSRAVAVVIDLAVLAAIDILVVYFTMQICGLTAANLHLLPKAPLFAFFFVQNGGYLVAFTAGGQTLGKMAMGIKVISTGAREQVDVPHSLLRTALWLLLAIPAGLGFLTALFSSERRGLHDRFAGTRVIKGIG